MAEEFVTYHPHLSEIARSGIRASFPVKGAVHGGIAAAVNWLVGRGHALVVGGPHTLFAPYALDTDRRGQNITYTYTHWVRADDLHATVILLVDLSVAGASGEDASCSASVEFPVGSGNFVAFTCGTETYPTRVAISAELPLSNAGQSVTFSISTSAYNPWDGVLIHVHDIHMFTAPLQRLDGNALVNDSFKVTQPIYAGFAEGASVGGLAVALPSLKSKYMRRNALLSWCAPKVTRGAYIIPGTTGTPGTPGTPGTGWESGAYVGYWEHPELTSNWPLGFVWQYRADWINDQRMVANDFVDASSWAAAENSGWMFGEWGDKLPIKSQQNGDGVEIPLVVALLLLPGMPAGHDPALYATGATGAYDSHFTNIMQTINGSGLKRVIIRLGWEFNLQPVPSTSSFITYWRRVVNAMRAVSTIDTLEFVFNPNEGQTVNIEACYPGADYVDWIAIDQYDHYAPSYTPGVTPTNAQRESAWQYYLTHNYGLNWAVDFARDMNKPLMMPEWGVWNVRSGGDPAGGDNPIFIQRMYDWIVANNVKLVIYHDNVGGQPGDTHRLWPGPPLNDDGPTIFPNAAAKYLELFSGGGTATGGTPGTPGTPGTGPVTVPTILTDGYPIVAANANPGFVNIFPLKPAMQTRLITQGQSTATARGNVYGKVSGGTAQVRVTMSKPGLANRVVTWNITSVSGAWSGEQVFQVACDDPNEWANAGFTDRDEALWQAKPPPSGTLWLHAIDVYEPPQ